MSNLGTVFEISMGRPGENEDGVSYVVKHTSLTCPSNFTPR